MSRKERKETISVRVPIEILDKIEDQIKDGKYKNQTDAVITKLQNSDHFDTLMEIAKDPEKQKEMNEKIKSMLVESSTESILESMTIAQRETVIFYATTLNNKALTQTHFR